MNRKTFDTLLSVAGFALAAVLAIAGGLLTWASTFVSGQVHDQLAAQQIFFPEADSDAMSDPEIGPYIEKYAGQQVTTGAQAEAFANHYIAVHIEQMSGGKTYSQLSEESRANPDDAEAAALVESVFRGETLRGILLNAYAFGTMGVIAGYAAIAAFAGALVFIVLSILGLVHRTRAAADDTLVLGAKTEAAEPATV